ncbi:unnamed protein product [Nezara viridula]|uniref:Uncharacterized protein n=1 Tax=Nezara viridula TaxID=85310 RepID=A0A9P0E1G4_NEZVI|nr:unnamed protein product [Nezara viridula]
MSPSTPETPLNPPQLSTTHLTPPTLTPTPPPTLDATPYAISTTKKVAQTSDCITPRKDQILHPFTQNNQGETQQGQSPSPQLYGQTLIHTVSSHPSFPLKASSLNLPGLIDPPFCPPPRPPESLSPSLSSYHISFPPSLTQTVRLVSNGRPIISPPLSPLTLIVALVLFVPDPLNTVVLRSSRALSVHKAIRLHHPPQFLSSHPSHSQLVSQLPYMSVSLHIPPSPLILHPSLLAPSHKLSSLSHSLSALTLFLFSLLSPPISSPISSIPSLFLPLKIQASPILSVSSHLVKVETALTSWGDLSYSSQKPSSTLPPTNLSSQTLSPPTSSSPSLRRPSHDSNLRSLRLSIQLLLRFDFQKPSSRPSANLIPFHYRRSYISLPIRTNPIHSVCPINLPLVIASLASFRRHLFLISGHDSYSVPIDLIRSKFSTRQSVQHRSVLQYSHTPNAKKNTHQITPGLPATTSANSMRPKPNHPGRYHTTTPLTQHLREHKPQTTLLISKSVITSSVSTMLILSLLTLCQPKPNAQSLVANATPPPKLEKYPAPTEPKPTSPPRGPGTPTHLSLSLESAIEKAHTKTPLMSPLRVQSTGTDSIPPKRATHTSNKKTNPHSRPRPEPTRETLTSSTATRRTPSHRPPPSPLRSPTTRLNVLPGTRYPRDIEHLARVIGLSPTPDSTQTTFQYKMLIDLGFAHTSIPNYYINIRSTISTYTSKIQAEQDNPAHTPRGQPNNPPIPDHINTRSPLARIPHLTNPASRVLNQASS